MNQKLRVAVINLTQSGMNTEEVAKVLDITVQEVENHLKEASEKEDV